MPRLQRVEHAHGGDPRQAGGEGRAAAPRAAAGRPQRLAEVAGAEVRAAADRHRRAGPDPRRRPRARLARADRRLARHRQVDADVMALGNLEGAGRKTLYVSGEESAAQIRLRAERLPGAALQVPVLAETDLDTVLATLEAERPEVCVIDSVQTLHAADLTGAAGSVGQVREVADRITRLAKVARHRGAARRPRDQGGRAGRPARARAPRRLRAAVRGRARAHVPHAAGAQEPLRLHERRRRVRDALRRPGRGRRTRPRASWARPRGRPAASCWRRWRARGRCWSRSRRWSRRPSSSRRGGWCNGIDRNRLALVLAVLGRHAGNRCRDPPMSSSTSRAACELTSRGPTSPSRWPWRAPFGA